jgi:hypothetical protein
VNDIAANSSIGNFVIASTVEDKVQVAQTVANYTVSYDFNYYEQSGVPLVNGKNVTGNNSYFNVVTFSTNVSEGTSKFSSLTSEEGKIL